MKKLTLNTDGGSRGNPGPAAYGFVVQEITNLDAGLTRRSHQAEAVIILEKRGNYLGVTTNNQAEYSGLIEGVKWVLAHYPDADLLIQMDSLLIVNQTKGKYKVKHQDIIPRHREAMALLSQLPHYSIVYVPRLENSLADELVNLVLDSHA